MTDRGIDRANVCLMGARTTRRATYTSGTGMLFADRDRLLFVAIAERAAVSALLSAAQSDRALDSLAALVASAGSEVPPFVFIQQDGDLQGMVVGAIEVVLADPENLLLRGDESDSGTRFQASNTTAVSAGRIAPMSMWIEVGFVHADAFLWAAAETAAPTVSPSLMAASGEGKNAAGTSAAGAHSGVEGDPTIVTAQTFAASLVPVTDAGSGLAAYGEAHTSISSATDDEPAEANQPLRTVDARVCLTCGHPNPPRKIRCRACSNSIADADGEIEAVPQPTLGILHLSGGGVESLNTDLLIGRNPTREPLEPHQRAIVHGQGDRSVSRRHIDLRLEGWQVVVTNLKADDHTIVESNDGVETRLAPGMPRTLEVGDTVRYGGSWFRYEEGP